METNGISPELIDGLLRTKDNNAYRQMMHDLRYDGDEPAWEKQDIYDSIK